MNYEYVHVTDATRSTLNSTSTTMISSFDLRIEVEALQELDSYDIPHDYDLTTEDPERLLEGDYLIFNPTQNLTIS